MKSRLLIVSVLALGCAAEDPELDIASEEQANLGRTVFSQSQICAPAIAADLDEGGRLVSAAMSGQAVADCIYTKMAARYWDPCHDDPYTYSTLDVQQLRAAAVRLWPNAVRHACDIGARSDAAATNTSTDKGYGIYSTTEITHWMAPGSPFGAAVRVAHEHMHTHGYRHKCENPGYVEYQRDVPTLVAQCVSERLTASNGAADDFRGGCVAGERLLSTSWSPSAGWSSARACVAETMVTGSLLNSDGIYLRGGMGGSLVADRLTRGNEERFSIFDQNFGALMHDDLVTLRSHHGYYWRAVGGGGGEMKANGAVPNYEANFRIKRLAGAGKVQRGDRIAFATPDGRWYVSSSGYLPITANRATLGSTETFVWMPHRRRAMVQLRTGLRFMHDAGGTLTTSNTTPGNNGFWLEDQTPDNGIMSGDVFDFETYPRPGGYLAVAGSGASVNTSAAGASLASAFEIYRAGSDGRALSGTVITGSTVVLRSRKNGRWLRRDAAGVIVADVVTLPAASSTFVIDFR